MHFFNTVFLQSNFHDVEQYKTIGFPFTAVLLSSLQHFNTAAMKGNMFAPDRLILQYVNTCMFTYTYRILSKSWYNRRKIISRKKSKICFRY